MSIGLREQLQETLGDAYAVERELGGGGMARVFVARDTRLGRRVVVKVLHGDAAAGVSAARFAREISVAARLQHPHVVPLFAAGDAGTGLGAGELLYYTMPLVEGESLRERLAREGALPIADTVRLVREMADALAHAHEQGVVHRDLKPENVLLSRGHAVVTDFGVAKAIATATQAGGAGRAGGESGTATAVGMVIGTPAYMAPEQAAGDPETDHRADLYALGVVAYELLAGAHPFAGRSARALAAAHLTEEPEPVGGRRPDAPPALAALVTQLLRKDPAERPLSADAVLSALDALTAPTAGGTAHAPRRSGRRLGLAAGTLVLAAVGALAAARWWPRPAPGVDARVVAVLPFRVAGADPALGYLREGMLDLLHARLTGEGLRATDPRSLLGAWRRVADAPAADLPRDEAIALARELGAGRVLLGDVVGTGTSLTLNATVLAVPDGRTVAQEQVAGPRDSLVALVDQLAARVLARAAGEGAQRLARLTRPPLPALRAYLGAQAAYRRGEIGAARTGYGEALAIDSTFALAGLGLQLAAQWWGADSLSTWAERMTWRERATLSARDRGLLSVLSGPNFPAPSSFASEQRAAERLVRLMPDSPEAWYLLGDNYFHNGAATGLADAPELARRAFERSFALDSTFVVPVVHQLALAVRRRDTTLARRMVALQQAVDTGVRMPEVRWLAAAAGGDTVRMRAERVALERSTALQNDVTRPTAVFDGVGVADAEQFTIERQRSAPSEDSRRRRAWSTVAFLLNLGRPREAMRLVRDVGMPAEDRHFLAVDAGLAWDADTIDAAAGAAALTKLAWGRSAAADSTRRLDAAVLSETWRLTRGDTSRTATTLSLLGQPASDSARAMRQLDITALEAMRAVIADAPRARAAVERLDSLHREGDAYGHSASARHALISLILARLHERVGAPERALAAVRRRQYHLGPGFYTPALLREEGRLAALTNDREGAIRAYRHYLALRYAPESSLRPEADAVREEIAQLERASAGR